MVVGRGYETGGGWNRDVLQKTVGVGYKIPLIDHKPHQETPQSSVVLSKMYWYYCRSEEAVPRGLGLDGGGSV